MNQNLKTWLDSLRYNATPDLNECINYLGNIFPLLKEFKNTIQDPIWHAEGDVHIHTDMVLKELYKIFENEGLNFTPEERQILILSALLHDIAKPICTKVVDGRVKASGHEIKGRDYLVFRLLELDLCEESYLQILNLVGKHQRPKLAVIKNLPREEYFQLSNLFSYHLMYWLEIADIRGRVCEDLEEQILYLDEYYQISKKLDDEDFLDISNNMHLTEYEIKVGDYLKNHGLIYSLDEASSKLYDFKANYPHAIILCGISGSGKSTYIKNNFKDYKVISMDNIRAELCGNRRDQSRNSEVALIAKERLKQALRAKEKVVWDATNTRKDFRDQLITLCHRYNALTELHVLLSKESKIRIQNKNREFNVPEEVITRQINKFQFPDRNEAVVVNYIIK